MMKYGNKLYIIEVISDVSFNVNTFWKSMKYIPIFQQRVTIHYGNYRRSIMEGRACVRVDWVRGKTTTNYLALHPALTPSNHFVQGLPIVLIPSTSNSFTLLFIRSTSIQNISIYSITHFFPHIESTPHLYIPPSIHPGHSSHTP